MPRKALTAADLKKYEAALRHMLGVVTGDIDVLAEETSHEAGRDVSTEDAGSEIAALELSLELLGKDEQTAQELLDALDRVKAKAYGNCETCQQPIPKGRLDAMPHARNCISCQRELEKKSAF